MKPTTLLSPYHPTILLSCFVAFLSAACGGKEEQERFPEILPATAVLSGGLKTSRVICQKCRSDILAAKKEGIANAMDIFLDFIDVDILTKYGPPTFHLDSDDICGEALEFRQKAGFLTGFVLNKQGKAHICLFDLEKENRSLPFTAENARLAADQVLPIHEAGHLWFWERQNNYAVQEPLVKFLSFVISAAENCHWFDSVGYPDRLMKDLCDAGFGAHHLPVLFNKVANRAATLGPLSELEFSRAVSEVMGKDVSNAFRQAGLIK